jgi:hypothetical protein
MVAKRVVPLLAWGTSRPLTPTATTTTTMMRMRRVNPLAIEAS